MRYLQCFLMFVLSATMVGVVSAKEDASEREGNRAGRGEFRQELLEEFDADGDGKLSEDEREKARETMQDRRGKGRTHERRRGPEGEGPPDPEKLFEQFDANSDNQLSREEFRKLAEAMREHHSQHNRGKGRPGESRGRRHGPEGASTEKPDKPRKERRDFDPPRTLQNPEERPKPPRGSAEGRPGRKPAGPDSHGFGRQGPPNPDDVFDRFDKNGDDQLSRQEFVELSDAMRRLRERFSGEGDKSFGGDRSERRGPPGRRGREESRKTDRRNAPAPDAEDDSRRKPAAAEDDSV